MDYLDRITDKDVSRDEEFDNYIEYMYKSAIKLIESGKLFGYDIDINNPKEVIATLYNLYLVESALKKDIVDELHFYGVSAESNKNV